MSTEQSTIDYILDQASEAGDLCARKMFGEYALYCNNKVVALVCDDQLFVKITEAGKVFLDGDYQEGRAYQKAKPSILVDAELIEDGKRLTELISLTADALPMPRPKKKKIKK
jgi:TfoX/Sxy family transcriptional regulator of competence genes